MKRDLGKSIGLPAGMAVLAAAFFAAGCTTTAAGKSGRMPNENTSKQAKSCESGHSQAIRPRMPLGGL